MFNPFLNLPWNIPWNLNHQQHPNRYKIAYLTRWLCQHHYNWSNKNNPWYQPPKSLHDKFKTSQYSRTSARTFSWSYNNFREICIFNWKLASMNHSSIKWQPPKYQLSILSSQSTSSRSQNKNIRKSAIQQPNPSWANHPSHCRRELILISWPNNQIKRYTLWLSFPIIISPIVNSGKCFWSLRDKIEHVLCNH